MKIEQLNDPYSNITKAILFIYSMESFITYNLNKAARNYDKDKIKSFGPYGIVLNQIISYS